MITYTHPVANNLPIKSLVATCRHLHSNEEHTQHTHNIIMYTYTFNYIGTYTACKHTHTHNSLTPEVMGPNSCMYNAQEHLYPCTYTQGLFLVKVVSGTGPSLDPALLGHNPYLYISYSPSPSLLIESLVPIYQKVALTSLCS